MKKIIVMDDEAAIRELLSLGLRAAGYAVEAVSSTQDLWDSIGREKPAVILMDAGMPGEDGISICRDIRRNEATKNIPVVIITAFNDDITRNDAFLFGATAFVTKPFTIPAVLSVVSECVNASSSFEK
ncbi:MAG: response regulator [Elusimicrobia bacterium]|nr:response regulator [Elusimicrobiota bacterium]